MVRSLGNTGFRAVEGLVSPVITRLGISVELTSIADIERNVLLTCLAPNCQLNLRSNQPEFLIVVS